MSSETFEQVLTAAQADGSFSPAWRKFVRTKFFVPIIRQDGDAKTFKLRMSDIMGDGKQSILISEVRALVEQHHGSALAALYGGDVVRMLHAEASILVALSDRAFNIARDRVEWLKQGLETSQARAAAKTGATPAPVVLPAAPPAATPAPSPTPAPSRRAGAMLDVASLKPRNITLPKIGLDFFVPSAWRQLDTATGLRFFDDQASAVIDASGFHRPNVPMAQWLAMRLDLVRHEMRYLQQDGQSYALDGEGWRDRVKGMATEFTGIFPGEDHASRLLVACICIDGTLACITIKAPTNTFELDRALYKWLLSRVDINPSAAIVYRPPAQGADVGCEEAAAPALFGMSFRGRLGRVRALAYSVPLMLPYLALALLAAVMGPSYALVMGILVVLAAIAMLWFSLRLMVMRMHDVNLSGKWLFAAPVLMGFAIVSQNPLALVVASALVWVAALVMYCFLPGTSDENDYGSPPGPNTTLVNLGAAAFVLLQLVAIGLIIKTRPYQVAEAPVAPAVAASSTLLRDPSAQAWSSPDGALSIDFPAAPREVALPKIVRDSLGGVQMHQYVATSQGRTYLVQVVDYGKTSASSLGTLEGMAMSVVGRDGVQVSEDRSLRYHGFEGREVRVAVTGGSMRSARFVIVGPRVYMAMATTGDDPAAMQKVDAFLQSFALAPPETN